jgi:hypothetical protein
VTSDTPVPTLPAGTRLLHIGIPKTGTTALQTAAARNRSELARHGVCYPGRSGNHREAICALMGRRLGWTGSGDYVPDIRLWNRLLAEVESHPASRSFLTHEFASESDDEQARRFRTALGDSVHVAITLRGFASLLSSSWQQYIKAGRRQPFERWLSAILRGDDRRGSASGFYKRNDQAAIVARWVGVMGPERVTVVIADKRRPTQLTDAFEDMLGLPRGLLRQVDEGGLAANRSLSLPEAELLRRLNVIIRKQDLRWQDFTALVRNGAVARLLQQRRPGTDEPPISLPTWAAEAATERGRRYAADIAASGCRIIGDPATLYAPVPSVDGALPKVDAVPVDAAAQALAGMVSAATGRGAFFDLDPHADSPVLHRLGETAYGRRWLQTSQATAGSTVTDLLAVAGLRAAGKVRSRLGR